MELNFTFIDNNEAWKSNKIIFSRNGVYYTKSGQILAATPLVNLVSTFLSVNLGASYQMSAPNRFPRSNAKQQVHNRDPKKLQIASADPIKDIGSCKNVLSGTECGFAAVEQSKNTNLLQRHLVRSRLFHGRHTGRGTRSNKGFLSGRESGLAQLEERKDAHFFQKPSQRPRSFQELRRAKTTQNMYHHIDPWLPGHQPFVYPR